MEMERRAAGVVFALNREVEGQNRVLLFGRLGEKLRGEDEESLRRDFKDALRQAGDGRREKGC